MFLRVNRLKKGDQGPLNAAADGPGYSNVPNRRLSSSRVLKTGSDVDSKIRILLRLTSD